jgi:hypothetical protein
MFGATVSQGRAGEKAEGVAIALRLFHHEGHQGHEGDVKAGPSQPRAKRKILAS